jgi:hypothetical protein
VNGTTGGGDITDSGCEQARACSHQEAGWVCQQTFLRRAYSQ